MAAGAAALVGRAALATGRFAFVFALALRAGFFAAPRFALAFFFDVLFFEVLAFVLAFVFDFFFDFLAMLSLPIVA